MVQGWRACDGPAIQRHRQMTDSGLAQAPARVRTDRHHQMMDLGSAQGCAGGDLATHRHRQMMDSGPVALVQVVWG